VAALPVAAAAALWLHGGRRQLRLRREGGALEAAEEKPYLVRWPTPEDAKQRADHAAVRTVVPLGSAFPDQAAGAGGEEGAPPKDSATISVSPPGPGRRQHGAPAGRASPWVPEKCELPAAPRRCSRMEANVEYTFDGAADRWTQDIRHVIGPEKCCSICQGTTKCKAWSWVKNAGPFRDWYRCFLTGSAPTGKRGKNGVISGLPPPRLSLVTPAKVEGPKGVSLFCFSLMRPGSSEVDLLEMQQQHGISIFLCDEYMVYSNKPVRLGSDLTASVINSDLKCKSGGDYGKALNSWIFIEVWRKVIADGRYFHHDWTVKVDPDAVFFPDRLKEVLQDHSEAGYVNNCKDGMHGPIEVVSRKAVGALAWDYRTTPNKTYPSRCVAAQELSRWGEDMFLDKCLMETLGVKREFDVRLMCEGSCGCPDWYWCQNGTRRVTFHPFKTVDNYMNCLANAMHKAEAMPPPPPPCAQASGQCGGRGWTGSTCCVKGHECVRRSAEYSECRPACVLPMQQCGGKHWHGLSCCTEGYNCTKKNEWYAQCRPLWAPPLPVPTTTTAAPTPSPARGADGCARAERQCGGKSWQGPSCCEHGYTCRRKDRWYSQCKPKGWTGDWGTNSSASAGASAGTTCAGPGEQCGGKEWFSCCVAGYTCTAKNSWYSDCRRPADM